ncbi:FixH family protein [Bacillus ndiopicus]|uniref:FixH family protein n=1 Tax=Bacillus ndiopicus TaxID=1347368 RepID=UPI0005A60FE3|nr:FixH family protein [Bacillus ndiopicus]
MKKWFLSLLAVPMILAACNDEPEVDTLDSGIMPQEIVVEIQTPEAVAVNEEIDLIAYVTQGEEAVDDASVQFEVWESGLKDEGHMIDGELDKDGVYKAKFKFEHDGVYYMFAHTTARSLHVMPKQQIIVGSPDMSKVLDDKSDNSMNKGDHNNHKEEDAEEKH